MGKISVSDLSIGDWVEIDGRPKRISSVLETPMGGMVRCQGQSITAFVEHISPIPLTPEILDKNGSRLVVVNKKFNDWHDNNITIRKYYNEDNYHLFVCGQKIEFKMLFIHQLQHALRLAGVGKEIVL